MIFLLFSNDLDVKCKLKMELRNRFQMKDLGEVEYILGMRIRREKGMIYVDQQKCIKQVPKKFWIVSQFQPQWSLARNC
jgi:hypothetical protein